MIETDILSAADKWAEEGRNIRRQLAAERTKLLERLKEIDARMSSLPRDASDPEPTPLGIFSSDRAPEIDEDASVPALVGAILKYTRRPMSAAEIITQVQNSRTGIKPEMVHSAIYRLKKREEIEAHGEKGSSTFTWKGTAR